MVPRERLHIRRGRSGEAGWEDRGGEQDEGRRKRPLHPVSPLPPLRDRYEADAEAPSQEIYP